MYNLVHHQLEAPIDVHYSSQSDERAQEYGTTSGIAFALHFFLKR